jgi:hypothetical protein
MDISKLPRLSKTDVPLAEANSDPGTMPPAAPELIASTSAAAAGYCACGAPLRAGARFCDSCGAPVAGARATAPVGYATPTMEAGTGAEVWISIAVGALLLLMQPRLLQFIAHKIFGSHFSPYIDTATGAEVPYTAQSDFWSDLGITLFGFVLIVEGLAIAFARRRGVVMAAFVLTVLTTAYNLGYLVMTFSSGVAILSAFAVAFGVYIAIFQWNLLQLGRAADLA